MPMYDLIEYSDSYSKTLGIIRQYCRDQQIFAANGDINDVNADDATTN